MSKIVWSDPINLTRVYSCNIRNRGEVALFVIWP